MHPHHRAPRAQQQQQRPVKSSKGGYLRCPFDISASFAQLAAKHVEAGQSSRLRPTAPLGLKAASGLSDKDGLRGDKDDDGLGRAWTRAGVGAEKLSAKEKRSQQELAELIYNNNHDAEVDDEPEEEEEGLHTEKDGGTARQDTEDDAKLVADVSAGTEDSHHSSPPSAEDLETAELPEEDTGSQTHRKIAEEGVNADPDGEGDAEEKVEGAEEEEEGALNHIIAPVKTPRSILQKSAEKSRRDQFGIDLREQQALRKAMPRFLRRGSNGGGGNGADAGEHEQGSMRRLHGSDVQEEALDDDEELLDKVGKHGSSATSEKHARRQDFHEHHERLHAAATAGEDGLSQRARKKARKRLREGHTCEPPVHGPSLSSDVVATKSEVDTRGVSDHAAGSTGKPDNPTESLRDPQRSPRVQPAAVAAEAASVSSPHGSGAGAQAPPKAPAAPMNRMQKLEEARLAALFGSKKKKKR